MRTAAWYNENMPSFRVETPQRAYDAMVERGCICRVAEFVPPRSGKLFVVTAADVWKLHGAPLERALTGRDHQVLIFPGGEARKRLAEVEALANQMMEAGGDRSSVVIAFGGGIVGDVAGILAAMFMRVITILCSLRCTRRWAGRLSAIWRRARICWGVFISLWPC
jgi:3-dehydroquinate synthase